jgi:hypothetical protein
MFLRNVSNSPEITQMIITNQVKITELFEKQSLLISKLLDK